MDARNDIIYFIVLCPNSDYVISVLDANSIKITASIGFAYYHHDTIEEAIYSFPGGKRYLACHHSQV